MGIDMVASASTFNQGPAWDGKALLFTHIPSSRILR
jgi:hypothetical protein